MSCLDGAAQFLTCPNEDVIDSASKGPDDAGRRPGRATVRAVLRELALDEPFNP